MLFKLLTFDLGGKNTQTEEATVTDEIALGETTILNGQHRLAYLGLHNYSASETRTDGTTSVTKKLGNPGTNKGGGSSGHYLWNDIVISKKYQCLDCDRGYIIGEAECPAPE